MELPSLPLPVLQNVLTFAVPGYADYKPPEWRNTRVVSVLKCRKEDHKSQNYLCQWVEIDWPRIFANLPTLKTLNLEANYIDSRHVIGALDAAATHCLNLETLVLPSQHFRGDDESIQAVLEKLYAAMKSWRLHGNRGGLRHLKNCPNVEYLDGYKASLSKIAGLTCKDGWLLTLEDWERLNAACTQLREFDWVVAPFGDPFFRVFGEHVKPQMKKLTFGVNMRWNWRRYFRDCNKAAGVHPDEDWDDDNYGNRQGYGLHATYPAAALKDMGDVNDFPEVEMVNQNVFDDRFCETLASECPFLTHFVIQEVGEYFNRKYLKPISTFTDRGLMALTQLKYLRFLQLRSINCTGKGIFEFLNAQSSELTGNRSFEVTVGGCPEDSTLAFYEVVKELLAQLADTSDLPCARQKFALRIENWSYNSRYSVDPAWSETYLSDLEKLMNRVKDAHPSLRQHVLRWTTAERENKDITIVDREDMLPDDRGFDDASDFDDYDDAYLDDDIYDGEGESDIDSEYLEDDSDFEM
ncbi:hypothetical protein PI125_g2417 [Phytophthora idaei]|nr:hypothetical protein PI125_g2417 [Phytophthora idaei]